MPAMKLLRREGNSVEIEFQEKDHTMANLVAKYAIKKPYVVYASYIVSHPLIGKPVVIITTDGSRDPLDVVEETLKEIIEDAQRLERQLKEALEKGERCEEGSQAIAGS